MNTLINTLKLRDKHCSIQKKVMSSQKKEKDSLASPKTYFGDDSENDDSDDSMSIPKENSISDENPDNNLNEL